MFCLKSVTSSTEMELLVAFTDLNNFLNATSRLSDLKTFGILSEFAELTGVVVERAGGTVVKFLGDGALIVFPIETVDDGVNALMELKDKTAAWATAQELKVSLRISAHCGKVAVGPLGTRNEKRVDVFGSVVNTAFTLPGRGTSITPQVFRQLSSSTRKKFKKHTPPVRYIPIDEPHRE